MKRQTVQIVVEPELFLQSLSDLVAFKLVKLFRDIMQVEIVLILWWHSLKQALTRKAKYSNE